MKHFNTKLPTNTVASCSFKGNWCTICSVSNSGHKLHQHARVLILGDEYLFPYAGSNEECFLVMRIQGGSFKQFQALLAAQNCMHFGLKEGSIVVPCLLAHLFRVGYHAYWDEFISFKQWIKSTMKVDVALCIPPFPKGCSYKDLSAIRQLYARLQAGHFGDSGQKKNLLFSLWRPLARTATLCNVASMELAVQPIFVANISGGVHNPCVGKFLAGFRPVQEWQHGMPPPVERAFLNSLSWALQKLDLPGIIILDESAVEAGLERHLGRNQPHKGRKIFLLGASNFELLAEVITERAIPLGVTVVPVCEAGDFLDYFLKNTGPQKMLKTGTSRDILFVNCLGNTMLAKDAHYSDKKGFHYLHPNLLNNQEFYNTSYDFNNMLEIIDGLFKGRVVVMGPMPRALSDCCGQPAHWIRDEKDMVVDMEKYTDAFSDHIFRAGPMFSRMTYVNYRTYLGKPFIPAMITDGVHWSKATLKEIANYCIQWLGNKAAANPKNAELDIEPFSDALLVKDIYVKPVTIEKFKGDDDSGSSEEEEEEEDDGDDGEQGEEEGGENGDEDESNPVFPPEGDNQNPSAQNDAQNGGNADMHTD